MHEDLKYDNEVVRNLYTARVPWNEKKGCGGCTHNVRVNVPRRFYYSVRYCFLAPSMMLYLLPAIFIICAHPSPLFFYIWNRLFLWRNLLLSKSVPYRFLSLIYTSFSHWILITAYFLWEDLGKRNNEEGFNEQWYHFAKFLFHLTHYKTTKF